MTEWSVWSECECGLEGGTRERFREVETEDDSCPPYNEVDSDVCECEPEKDTCCKDSGVPLDCMVFCKDAPPGQDPAPKGSVVHKRCQKYFGMINKCDYPTHAYRHLSNAQDVNCGSYSAASCDECGKISARQCSGDCHWDDSRTNCLGGHIPPVNCGGHQAPSCKFCPGFYGYESRCNVNGMGDCIWIKSWKECIPLVPGRPTKPTPRSRQRRIQKGGFRRGKWGEEATQTSQVTPIDC